MKILSNKNSILFLLVAGLLFTGCGTTTLQTKAKLTKTVVLDHSLKDNKYIYLQVTNTAGSGGEDMTLSESIKTNLEKKGYTVVNKSSLASYGLFVNVLFANNLREANAIKSAKSSGTSAALVAFSSGNGGADSLLIGAGFALGGAIIGSALEDEVFRAVVDIRIRDYKDNHTVKTINTISEGDATILSVNRAGNFNQLAGSLGDKNGGSDMNSNIREIVSSSTLKNYEEYRTRSLVEATRMNLEIKEALPLLESKISRQIANLF